MGNVFKEGFEGWRKLLFPTKREMLAQVFGTMELPPPAILEKMLGIDYPNWPKMCRILATFWGAVPRPGGPFFVPIYERIPVAGTLEKIIQAITEDATEEEKQTELYKRLRHNILEMGAAKGRDGPLWPHEFTGSDKDLIKHTVRNTAFYELFTTAVQYEFPLDQRMVHTTITASSQSGKTYLMKTQVLDDATRDNPYACIIIDPKDDVWDLKRGKGALWEHLARDRSITNKVLIDPSDVPAINLFDVQDYDLNKLSDSYDYFFTTILGHELSDNMKPMLRNVIALCLQEPSASLDTMREVLIDIEPFRKHFPQLSEVERQYFETEFVSEQGKIKGDIARTRDALRQRVNSMRSSSMAPMFRAAKNMIKIRQWIDERKTIIVHASPNKLGKDFKAFGRYFIAEAVRAGRSRRTVHPCFLYVDEASNFFDPNIELIFNYMATSQFAGVFAFQQWNQAQRAGVASAMDNAQVKIFGGHSDDDLALFKEKFYPDQRGGRLDALPAGNFYARLAGKPAFTMQVPRLVDNFMSDEEYKAFREENRKLVTSPPSSPKVDPPKPPSPSGDNVDLD